MGCGGGAILIYMLTTFLRVEQHIAQGANLIFFIPTSITAIIANWKNKNINKKTAFWVIIAGIIGAIMGARFSINLNVIELRKYFGYFLLFIAGAQIYNLKKEYINYKITNNKVKNKWR